MTVPVTMLVVAKAPVPGLAKTRLAAALGAAGAADVAAAALLDTLDAVAATPAAARVVALTGDIDAARSAAELRERLTGFTVIPQRGNGFGERLANAHHDAGEAGYPVVQIGMDTPQVSATLLADCARRLLHTDAVLGPAQDGGWWLLGLRDVDGADCLRTVPMSRSDTGARTLRALADRGLAVELATELTDVDVLDDIVAVRSCCRQESRFRVVTSVIGV
jgi:rSAM/selenodomain-associated transferase 1